MCSGDGASDDEDFDPDLMRTRLEGLVAKALDEPDPPAWVRGRIEDALQRLVGCR